MSPHDLNSNDSIHMKIEIIVDSYFVIDKYKKETSIFKKKISIIQKIEAKRPIKFSSNGVTYF